LQVAVMSTSFGVHTSDGMYSILKNL